MDQMDQLLSVWGFAAPESNGLLSGDDTEPTEHDQQSVLRNNSEGSGLQKDAVHPRSSLSEQADASTSGTVKDVETSADDASRTRGTRSQEEVDDCFNHRAFETEPSQDADADAEVQAPSSSKDSGPSRRRDRQASNREHQRRWRIRQKERSQSVQKQLCIAATELEELKKRQQQLEVKNHTHEHAQACKPAVDPVLHVNQTPVVIEAIPDGELFVPADHFDACNKPILTISLSGRKLPASSHEVSRMPMDDFVALWTAYNVELRRCLVSLSCSPEAHVESSMQQLTLEALRLVGCRLLMNPQLHQAFMTGQYPAANTGQIRLGQVVQQQLDRTFYTSLLIVLALSDEQVQDLMLVRLLYHSKRIWLRQQRRQLMSQMSDVEDQSSHPCQHLCEMTDLSKHLKDNSAHNHQLYYRIARVVYRGLLSTRQSADIIVHSYPYMPLTEILLDTIAAQAGYPSRQQIEAAAPLDPLTADWEMFGEYAKLVASKQTHGYLQMCQQSGGQRWWLHRCPSSTDPHS